MYVIDIVVKVGVKVDVKYQHVLQALTDHARSLFTTLTLTFQSQPCLFVPLCLLAKYFTVCALLHFAGVETASELA